MGMKQVASGMSSVMIKRRRTVAATNIRGKNYQEVRRTVGAIDARIRSGAIDLKPTQMQTLIILKQALKDDKVSTGHASVAVRLGKACRI